MKDYGIHQLYGTRRDFQLKKIFVIHLQVCTEHMIMFWNHRGELKKRRGDLRSYMTVVGFTSEFNWKVFLWIQSYEPRPCIENYKWNTSKQSVTGGSYTGKQGSRKQFSKRASPLNIVECKLLFPWHQRVHRDCIIKKSFQQEKNHGILVHGKILADTLQFFKRYYFSCNSTRFLFQS